jgi:hypothetical protein
MANYPLRPIVLVIGLSLLATSPAFAEPGWEVSLASFGSAGSLAIDLAGTTHVAGIYYDRDELTYTAYNRIGVRGPRFVTRLHLSDAMDLATAIATDSHNRPHIAFVYNSFNHPSQLKYFNFDGHGWRSQTVDTFPSVNYNYAQLALDSNDHPHIAYIGPTGFLTHAYFNGSAWQFENIGVHVAPTAIRVAANGTVHIAGFSDIINVPAQVCEERGLDGSWTGECFDSVDFNAPPSLALASDGTPEVAYGADDPFLHLDMIKVARFDGINWSTQSTFNSVDSGLSSINFAVIAIDSVGLAKIILVDDSYTLLYVAEEGATWAITNLGSADGIFSISLNVDSIGLPHLALSVFDNFNFEFYAVLNLPDLSNHWKSVVSRPVSGKTVITGKLLVSNLGSAPSTGYIVNYYLSPDNQLEPGDTQLGSAKLAVGGGQQKIFTFNFSPSAPVSGEYLIAAISPNNPPDEVNASNIAAVLIP